MQELLWIIIDLHSLQIFKTELYQLFTAVYLNSRKMCKFA